MNRISHKLRPFFVLALAACATTGNLRTDPDRVADAEAFARSQIAREQEIANDTIPERTVGVAPLRIATTDTTLQPLAYGLADLIMTDLAQSRSLRVVDRLRFDAILRELSLVSAGRVDPATAPQVGRLVQARRLVLGSATQLSPNEMWLEAGIADVSTGELRTAVSARAALDDIFAAEKALVFSLFDALGVQLTPAERTAVEQRATQNLAALLAYSRGVRYEVEGRYDAAASEYQDALRLDPAFSMAGTRLGGAATAAPRAAGAAVNQIARAAGAAVARVNTSIVEQLAAPPSGPADPSFERRTVTIIVTITTPP
jgi:TolB-like protein